MKKLILVLLFCVPGLALSQTLTPFVALGAYHRVESQTDRALMAPRLGTDTPGTIDLGIHISSCEWFLWASGCDIVFHHQSYVDHGFPADNTKPETYIGMIGIRFTWDFDSLSISF